MKQGLLGVVSDIRLFGWLRYIVEALGSHFYQALLDATLQIMKISSKLWSYIAGIPYHSFQLILALFSSPS